MLAALIDGLDEGGASSGAGADRRQPGASATATAATATAPTCPRCFDHGDVLGRCRPAADDAAPGPRQLRDRGGCRRRAEGALQGQVGRDGDHRAGGGLRLGRDPHHGGPRRRRVRAQRREDLRHLRRARRPRRRLGEPRPEARPRGDQVVRGRALQPGPEARPPRAQARHPRLRHRRLHPRRLPRPRRRTCSAAPRSTRRRASAARCGRSTTRARSSPRWPAASPGPASSERPSCSPRPASRSIRTAPPTPRAPRRPSCSSSRPTSRPPGC